MVKDKYGNYVVQKMIEVAEPKIKDNIIKRIEDSNSLKKRDGFSKHVLNFIEKNRNTSGQQSHSQPQHYNSNTGGHQSHYYGK